MAIQFHFTINIYASVLDFLLVDFILLYRPIIKLNIDQNHYGNFMINASITSEQKEFNNLKR